MVQDEQNPKRGQPIQMNTTMFNLPTNAHEMSSEEDLLADVDEPPDLERTPRPSALRLNDSFKASFSKSSLRCERKESLLTSALHSNSTSPVEEFANIGDPVRGMSCTSIWSNNSSMSAAELTSDGGFTSSGTRTPSPPPPASSFRMGPTFTLKSAAQRVAILHHDEDNISPIQKLDITPTAGENVVEATLGRKRCISFACGAKAKSEKKAEPEVPKPVVPSEQTTEPPKRACTIKFACPTKISTDAPSKDNKPRRAASPAPPPAARRSRAPPRSPKVHRGSDSTVRNPSPVAVRKSPAGNRQRRLSANSDLARCEAFRFHEFASSEEEVQEWTLESTCHRRPLTIKDTLRVENGLRQLGEEAEEEALDDEEEENMDEVDEDEVELDDDEDDLDEDDSDAPEDVSSDEGFQTDDEGGFAGSDDESDAGSDYNWWAPGHSTAATSFEHLDIIRSHSRRSLSESSIGSPDSSHNHYKPEKTPKRRKSRPVNIRIPSPELPDSTDFVCGTLDEDRPLEDAYMSALERRRAAKHKKTPQDVDPTFPTSDPEMDEEDEDDEDPNNRASESDHFMMHGQMDPPNGDLRGRRRSGATKRSPAQSPKRLRSPPPPAKRIAHRSPPPHRKLFGTSPRPLRSPPAPARLRSPPPTRRESSTILSPKRPGMSIHFAGLAGRPAPTTSTSLPRTPITGHPPTYDIEDDEDTPNEFPVRRAIDIKVGLERKRQRRKEQLYKKKHCKNVKEKRPPPGKGAERMREVGLGLAAHRGKNAAGFAFHAEPTPDKNDIHVLSF